MELEPKNETSCVEFEVDGEQSKCEYNALYKDKECEDLTIGRNKDLHSSRTKTP